MDRVVVALYDNIDDARLAVEELIREGYPHGDISIVTRDDSGEYSRYIGETKVEEGTESALAGAGIGAAIGGIGGLLLGLGALAIPGIGPIIAAGPLAAALAGAATGAVVGGILGALMEVGIPEEDAKYFAKGVEQGGTLVTVNTTEDMSAKARDILNRYNPVDLDRRSTDWGMEAPQKDLEYIGENTRTASTGATTDVSSPVVDTDFGQYEPTFRADYDRNFAYTGRSWDVYRPAYYYGYELASDERYRGRTWSDIEADARRDWDQRYGDTLWDDIKDAVRSAWDTITGRR